MAARKKLSPNLRHQSVCAPGNLCNLVSSNSVHYNQSSLHVEQSYPQVSDLTATQISKSMKKNTLNCGSIYIFQQTYPFKFNTLVLNAVNMTQNIRLYMYLHCSPILLSRPANRVARRSIVYQQRTRSGSVFLTIYKCLPSPQICLLQLTTKQNLK